MHTLAQLTARIEEAMHTLAYPDLVPSLYDPIRYTLETGGKRVRPTLVLMAADTFGGDLDLALAPALGIEMYHNFTLLHDDVMDKAPERRGRPTVHVRWNANQAILSGDAMQGLAYQLIARTPSDVLPQVLDAFNRMNLEICEGQQMDMEFETRSDVTVAEYLQMIRLKTSVLLGHALEIGALVAGAPADDISTLYAFGESIGLAFQLKDDWLDCWGDPATFGKRIGGDILCDKKTYLRITAEAQAPMPDTAGMTEADKIATVKAYYVATGAEAACREAIARYHQAGLDALDRLSVAPGQTALLRDLAARLADRDK